MRKNISVVAGIIAAIIAMTVIAVVLYNGQKSDEVEKSQWVVSGPFGINKSQYRLAENIFITVNNLKPQEAGNIVIIRPSGDVWGIVPFNGTLKDHFNYYFKPNTNAAMKIMTLEDLVGTWKIVFQGVSYEPVSFEIINEFIPGGEAEVKPIPVTNSTS